MASDKLSNVIGAPFAEHILTQLNLRAAHNSTGDGAVPTRSNDEVLFLANKMAWVKLTSSVRVQSQTNNGVPTPVSEFYKKLDLNYANPDDLAKNWILEAGTSKADGANINLRYGIGPDGAYGLGGTEELGYRPMPGLTSVTIDTKGTLGSLREATIHFKVWNMNQLNVIEALYFRLGYSMLLEWGHNQFYTNVGPGGTFTTNTYGINPFQPNLRKEIIQQQIGKRSYQLSGNYDGMLGVVTNFHWAFNQTGGYDCTVRLVGLGAIMDSLKINLSYRMPSSLLEAYKSEQATLQEEQQRIEKIKADNTAAQTRRGAGLPPTVATPTNASQIYTNVYTADKGTPSPALDEKTFLENIIVPSVTLDNYIFLRSYYYKADTGGKTEEGINNQAFKEELNKFKTGLFLSPIQGVRANWQLIPAENLPKIVLSAAALNAAAANTNAERGTLGTDTFVQVFDRRIALYKSENYVGKNGTTYYPIGNIIYREKDIVLQKGVVGGVNEAPITITYNQPYTLNNVTSNVNFTISYTPLAKYESDEAPSATREEIIEVLQQWFTKDRSMQITSMTANGKVVTIQGQIKLNTWGGELTFDISFTNTALIESVGPLPVPDLTTPSPTQDANEGATDSVDNSANAVQTDPGYRFASALHAMLAAAKSQVEYQMTQNQDGVVVIDLFEQTKKFYEGTISEGLLNLITDLNTTEFNLLQYAKKGFNSNLMVQPELFNKIPDVEFKELTKAYGIRWSIQNDTNVINHPSYLKLGYLLSFINSMCLVYDSTQDVDKHPYVYIDYNPATNLCLSIPQHMSVDPFTCMIPYQGNKKDYLELFPSDIAPDADATIFNENLNAVSGYLPKFKTSANAYQGSTMEILLNIDFLISTLNARTTTSQDHVVDLKGFLDDIMTGINKATGNLNSFRVAYRDDSNTVIIKDDQFVPPISGEAWALSNKAEPSDYGVPNGLNVPKYGQLPVFGKYSLVRDMKLETDMSTKLSSMIAISGQSSTTAVNSTDHSSLSWLNTNFFDTYKPKITDTSNTNSKSNSNQLTQEEKTAIENNNNKAASEFNQHVISIYQGGVALSRDMVDSAKNYYINGIAKVKSNNNITLAAPFIPANINLTIDGIAGIIMGNAFTIPEDRLPLSLRGQGGANRNTKVGFVVVGLTHTLENNQWLTRIRGQMIRLRDSTDYGSTTTLKNLQLNFAVTNTAVSSTATGPLGDCKYGYGCTRKNGDAYKKAELYQNADFRAGVDAITRKFGFTDSTALYKVMYAESGLKPGDTLNHNGKPFAVGLIQFTPDNVKSGLIPSLDTIARMSGIDQLKYVEKYFNAYAGLIRGGDIYSVYGAVFFPLALKHLNDPNWIIQSSTLSPYIISKQNPAIACKAGKQPGTPLTIADFKKYIDCIT